MKKIVTYCLIIISFLAKAQQKEKDKFLPKGNEAFEEKNYIDAEADYRISQSKFSKKPTASYNLGNAIYKQKQSGEAKLQFAKAIKASKTKPEKHKAFHNLGNCLMNDKDYQGAVEAYKNALRNNPNDEQTRYNYALAKKMLKENPPKKDDNKNKEKNKDKKDEKKDNKDQNKDKDKEKQDQNKDQQDKNKEDDKDKDKKEEKDQNNGQPKPQPGDMSKERLKNLLDAVNNEERKVQDKVNKQKANVPPKKAEKDW